jgi:hypothetical protein
MATVPVKNLMRSSSELLLRISLHDTNAKMVKTRSNKKYVNVLNSANVLSGTRAVYYYCSTTTRKKLRNMIL